METQIQQKEQPLASATIDDIIRRTSPPRRKQKKILFVRTVLMYFGADGIKIGFLHCDKRRWAAVKNMHTSTHCGDNM